MLKWFLGSRWGRGMGEGVSKVPGLQAKEAKVRLIAQRSPHGTSGTTQSGWLRCGSSLDSGR